MNFYYKFVTGLQFEATVPQPSQNMQTVIRNFEIIGEATKNLPNDLKAKYPSIPWEEMYRLRNRISHEYFGIDYEIIWEIATRHLPVNYEDVKIVLKDLQQK